MKKQLFKLFAVVVLAGFVFTSCNKEEEPTAASLSGTYAVSDVITGYDAGTYTYTATVTASSTDETKILISNFGGFPTSVTITGTVSNNGITIASQTPSEWAGMSVSATIAGTGTTTDANNIGVISYTVTYLDGDVSVCNATYTKQ